MKKRVFGVYMAALLPLCGTVVTGVSASEASLGDDAFEVSRNKDKTVIVQTVDGNKKKGTQSTRGDRRKTHSSKEHRGANRRVKNPLESANAEGVLAGALDMSSEADRVTKRSGQAGKKSVETLRNSNTTNRTSRIQSEGLSARVLPSTWNVSSEADRVTKKSEQAGKTSVRTLQSSNTTKRTPRIQSEGLSARVLSSTWNKDSVVNEHEANSRYKNTDNSKVLPEIEAELKNRVKSKKDPLRQKEDNEKLAGQGMDKLTGENQKAASVNDKNLLTKEGEDKQRRQLNSARENKELGEDKKLSDYSSVSSKVSKSSRSSMKHRRELKVSGQEFSETGSTDEGNPYPHQKTKRSSKKSKNKTDKNLNDVLAGLHAQDEDDSPLSLVPFEESVKFRDEKNDEEVKKIILGANNVDGPDSDSSEELHPFPNKLNRIDVPKKKRATGNLVANLESLKAPEMDEDDEDDLILVSARADSSEQLDDEASQETTSPTNQEQFDDNHNANEYELGEDFDKNEEEEGILLSEIQDDENENSNALNFDDENSGKIEQVEEEDEIKTENSRNSILDEFEGPGFHYADGQEVKENNFGSASQIPPEDEISNNNETENPVIQNDEVLIQQSESAEAHEGGPDMDAPQPEWVIVPENKGGQPINGGVGGLNEGQEPINLQTEEQSEQKIMNESSENIEATRAADESQMTGGGSDIKTKEKSTRSNGKGVETEQNQETEQPFEGGVVNIDKHENDPENSMNSLDKQIENNEKIQNEAGNVENPSEDSRTGAAGKPAQDAELHELHEEQDTQHDGLENSSAGEQVPIEQKVENESNKEGNEDAIEVETQENEEIHNEDSDQKEVTKPENKVENATETETTNAENEVAGSQNVPKD